MQSAPVETDYVSPAAAERSASFSYEPRPRGLLALEGGSWFAGELGGSPRQTGGELIFSTAASGWGEILSDPSYAGQLVLLTHPMVGSYRIAREELESDRLHARGLIVNRLVEPPAGPGLSLAELLREADVPVISGIDTRALTLELRRGAARRGVIVPGPDASPDEAVELARRSPTWESVDHVAAAATGRPFHLAPRGARRGRAVLIDYGVKRSLLTAVTDRGWEVVGLPADAAAADVSAAEPDLVILSPGPGDPARMAPQIAVVRRLAATAAAGGPPILGVCLGHQLLGLAAGARTRRLEVGHHGGNHAVIEAATGRVDIGAHNHEVTVVDDPALAGAGYRVSHRDLNDGSVEGLVHASGRIASVQFHPEGAPGPIDAAYLFDRAGEAIA